MQAPFFVSYSPGELFPGGPGSTQANNPGGPGTIPAIAVFGLHAGRDGALSLRTVVLS